MLVGPGWKSSRYVTLVLMICVTVQDLYCSRVDVINTRSGRAVRLSRQDSVYGIGALIDYTQMCVQNGWWILRKRARAGREISLPV